MVHSMYLYTYNIYLIYRIYIYYRIPMLKYKSPWLMINGSWSHPAMLRTWQQIAARQQHLCQAPCCSAAFHLGDVLVLLLRPVKHREGRVSMGILWDFTLKNGDFTLKNGDFTLKNCDFIAFGCKKRSWNVVNCWVYGGYNYKIL